MVHPWVTNRSAAAIFSASKAAIFSASNCLVGVAAHPAGVPTSLRLANCSLNCINCEVKCIAVATLGTSKAPSSSLMVRPFSKPQMCFWGAVAGAPL